MDESHSFVSITCCNCGHSIRVPVYCGNRFCPECSGTRRRKIEHRLKVFVRTRHPAADSSFKHLTLTVRSGPDLDEQVKHLVGAFRRLRQRAFWKRAVTGGAFVVEITRGEHGWHAHIHALIESKYIPWSTIKVNWEAVSGGSGVFIQRIPASAIIRYLTKYITKTELSLPDQMAASAALKGMRLFSPFGAWHKPIAEIPLPLAVCGNCKEAVWVFGDVAKLVHDAFGKDPRERDPTPEQTSFIRNTVNRVTGGKSIVPVRVFKVLGLQN